MSQTYSKPTSKTLLLVFIHGFKGTDDTFGSFPAHLRALLTHALSPPPRSTSQSQQQQQFITVVTKIYPKFETRGDLTQCVARFREWLETVVIDLEVEMGTASPVVDPGVHVVLVGHSMGGIVAAETVLGIAGERPITGVGSREYPMGGEGVGKGMGRDGAKPGANHVEDDPSTSNDRTPSSSFMFPHIQGVLAFDTPYLGLAPGMVAHSIEGGSKMASQAYSTYNEIATGFGWGSSAKATTSAAAKATTATKAIAALPAPALDDAAASPRWQTWGKYAMFAGAAGAVAAGGAAALYSQREKISVGWQWASSHLLFVNSLARPEELRRRVGRMEEVCEERGIGWGNFYTNLGRGARGGYGVTEGVLGKDRTFCNLPAGAKNGGKSGSEQGLQWHKAVNDKSTDETLAHVSMFFPQDNPGFYNLGERAKEVVLSWVDSGWAETSQGQVDGGTEQAGRWESKDPRLRNEWGQEQSRSTSAGVSGEQDQTQEAAQPRSDDRYNTSTRDAPLVIEEEDHNSGWQGLDDFKHAPPPPDHRYHLRSRDGAGTTADPVNENDMMDLSMTDVHDDGMEGSVIVDKAGKGQVLLPTSPEN